MRSSTLGEGDLPFLLWFSFFFSPRPFPKDLNSYKKISSSQITCHLFRTLSSPTKAKTRQQFSPTLTFASPKQTPEVSPITGLIEIRPNTAKIKETNSKVLFFQKVINMYTPSQPFSSSTQAPREPSSPNPPGRPAPSRAPLALPHQQPRPGAPSTLHRVCR